MGPSPSRFWHVGTGSLIDAHGLDVTAAHVVDGRDVAMKPSDGRVMTAPVLAADAASDIAIICLPTTLRPRRSWGATTLRSGDRVIAIGEPFGLGACAVAGIVGGRNRHFADDR